MAYSSENPLRDSFAVHSLDSDTVAADSQGLQNFAVPSVKPSRSTELVIVSSL